MFEEGGDEVAEESFAMCAVAGQMSELWAASCHGEIVVVVVVKVWARGSGSEVELRYVWTLDRLRMLVSA